jgi:hypothetical protein
MGTVYVALLVHPVEPTIATETVTEPLVPAVNVTWRVPAPDAIVPFVTDHV